MRLIIFIGLALAALITKLAWRRAYTFAKPLPVIFILVLAFLLPGRVPPLWFAAIAFGLAGDILLIHEKGFVPGLISFLVGHLFYIQALNGGGGLYYTPALLLGVGAISIGVSSFFTRHLLQARRKKYIVPVVVYTLVSGVMVMQAFRYPMGGPAVLGVICFAFSDFLLAFDKFVRPIWYMQAGVSVAYYAAQWLLALHFRAI
jgi:uncharacterized membrane protein YhhN